MKSAPQARGAQGADRNRPPAVLTVASAVALIGQPADGDGRRRWLDAYWEEARLVVEVDGLWHMEVAAWWADMRRDNDLTISGLRVLRFPAFAVRDHPGVVAAQIRSALDGGRVARV